MKNFILVIMFLFFFYQADAQLIDCPDNFAYDEILSETGTVNTSGNIVFDCENKIVNIEGVNYFIIYKSKISQEILFLKIKQVSVKDIISLEIFYVESQIDRIDINNGSESMNSIGKTYK